VAKPVAVTWIRGWGVNFYSSTYVAIRRALAKRGYTTITGNTRMHDLGNVEAWRGEKRIGGGGYWGVASEEMGDLAAWLDFAEALGFKKVVLVSHSAGATAVQTYEAQTQDMGTRFSTVRGLRRTDPPGVATSGRAASTVPTHLALAFGTTAHQPPQQDLLLTLLFCRAV